MAGRILFKEKPCRACLAYVVHYNVKEKRDMEQLIQLFRALSEVARLRIVMLLTNGELCVCDLMVILEEPQSKISRHLAYLNHSGLTKSKRVGVWMHYSLKEPLSEVCKAQIDLLGKQLSHLPQFRSDREKLLKLEKQGGCMALLKLKSGCWSRMHKARKKHATLS